MMHGVPGLVPYRIRIRYPTIVERLIGETHFRGIKPDIPREEMLPEPMPKRSSAVTATAAAAADDRLSALPDGGLHYILSFLPVPEMVRTTVLSRRWRDLWCYTPYIKIDQQELGVAMGDWIPRHIQEQWTKFEDFTTNLLLFHCNTVILDKFQLYAQAQHRVDVDRWIRRGIKYCPRVLKIIMTGKGRFELKLHHVGSSFRRLKTLHLFKVTLDIHFVEVLRSHCSVPEEMKLMLCSTSSFHYIASPTLKKLDLDSCDQHPGHTVGITAPCLESFDLCILSGCYQGGISLCETTSHLEALVSIERRNHCPLENQRRLIGSLFNATILELNGFDTMAFLNKNQDELPIYPAMRTLSLGQCFLDEYDLNNKLEALYPDTEWDIKRKSITLHRCDMKTFHCPKLKLIEVCYEDDVDHRLTELSSSVHDHSSEPHVEEKMNPHPAEKRACASGAGDRLSALPDDLLHRILSFLPAMEVVQTTVLSRRWKDLWCSTPFIHIDDKEFGEFHPAIAGDDPEAALEQWDRFENFTTNFLLFHSNSVSLNEFRLCAHNGWSFDHSHSCRQVRDVVRWIRRGIKYCPQVLDMESPGGSALTLPHLEPSVCHRLRRLCLTFVSLDSRFGELLYSDCSVLEDLELIYCHIYFQDIISSTLKKLVLQFCCHFTTYPVVIKTPGLASLHLDIIPTGYQQGISVCKPSSIGKATISINYICHFTMKNQRRLLGSLFSVTSLELNKFKTMAFLNKKSDEFPIFPLMRTLSLVKCFHDKCDLDDKLEALGSFLQNAPCLEKLTLSHCKFDMSSGREWDIARKSITLRRHDKKAFQCQKLKLIEIIYPDDRDHRLTELVWRIGRILPDADIKLTRQGSATMEMEARVDSTSDEDRLSVLPGVLIHAILSSAGADQRSVQEVEAPVWRSTPCLNINQREFFGPGWITFWKDCERIVTDTLLAQHHGSILDTFQLCVHEKLDLPKHIDPVRWIRCDIKRFPRVLCIHSEKYFGKLAMPLEPGSSLCRLTRSLCAAKASNIGKGKTKSSKVNDLLKSFMSMQMMFAN
uniref:F-box domain-containing protein n=1 Tax=Leersia perrieri TaxID=77586 RepID=A0A0D9W5B3_9ORYZ